jgi:predicted MPP superfamily phosphohydrolase
MISRNSTKRIKCRNYIKGLYSINNSYLYVSSGLGNYPISIRLFNRPEIAVIKLR